MFATTSRARQHQRESPPPPGTDSCYGVRSLNGSVSWDGGSGPDPAHMDQSETQPDQDSQDDNEIEPTLAPSPTIIPPSPDDTLHPLSPREYDEHPSTPSSPASFTSLPSYVASVSSVSRTSSPVGSAADFARQAGSEDLVLPMLSLPSTSLHMSLRRWEGESEVGGLKVVLAGDEETTRRLVRGIGERYELAEMGKKGEVGVVRAGSLVAMLITGLTSEQVRARVMESYTALDGLLQPSPPAGARGPMEGLISSYAAKSDWAHLIFALDADDELVNTLAPIVPTISSDKRIEGLFLLPAEEIEAESSRAGTPSPSRDPDPTPMLTDEALNYFAPREPTPPMEVDPVDLLIRSIDSATLIQQASTAKFFSWRPQRSLESSITSSVSPASSASDIGGPMPTVARAQGGGEWEAGLSRRVAQRKDLHHVHRGRVRRRPSKSPERQPCTPLFPKSAPKTASVGLNALAESIFRPMRAMWDGQKGWRRTVLLCTVVMAVGWGCWVKAR